jgi:LPS export ABC transporter protein LptC
MLAHTRNLVLFGALAGAAVLTGIFARGRGASELEPGPQESAAQGYLLQDAILNVTDEHGNLYYKIFADRIEQHPDTKDFALDHLEVRYVPQSDVSWSLMAARGYMPKDRAYFQLDDVSLFYTPSTGDEVVTFQTSRMLLDAKDLYASTDQPVIFKQGRSETRAVGLSVNLEADTFELESNVTTRFFR